MGGQIVTYYEKVLAGNMGDGDIIEVGAEFRAHDA